VWKLERNENRDEGDGSDGFGPDLVSPYATISKYTETVTAIKLREDGQVVLSGDRQGNIQLYEIKKRLALRTYNNEHKN
jgi:hypothetical protein